MQTKLQKGFTIIELIVVIAIIAVLATIVLVNVTGYINLGKNAAIKGNMDGMVTNAADYFNTTPSYANWITGGPAADYASAKAAVEGDFGSGYVIADGSSATAWCSCSKLLVTSQDPATSYYCVDSTGNKKETTTACSTECATGTGWVCQ